MTIRRNFIFQSTAFNTSEPKEYFINESCFGDDLARWLIERLRAQGFHVEPEPRQEDFGWYLTFRFGEAEYDLVIGCRPGVGRKPGDWMGTIERRAGFWASIFGARSRGVQVEAPEALHAVLSPASEISNLRWFSDADYKKEENGQKTPTAA